MNGLIKKIKSGGPAAIITSAFIGPGTIIVSTKVGATFGYQLIWATVFAVVALMMLMEMASRIAIVSKQNLIEASINVFPKNSLWKNFICGLMLITVLAVCFAFQTGNLTGGGLGLATILGVENKYVIIFMTIVVLLITTLGSSKSLEFIMKIFVGLMGIIFIITMLFVKPPVGEMVKGLVPIIPSGAYLLTLALIGTTLIGINLILHSITSKNKWSSIEQLSEARWDIGFNIFIGGMITLSIVTISATVLRGVAIKGNPALAFTQSLEPILGNFASIFGNLGLFAAGLSSAIAIPFTFKNIIAAIFKFEGGAEGKKSKILATIVILFGATLAIVGKNPQEIIILAQATSGLFLPIITILILIVANNKKLLGEHVNNKIQNIVGILVVILTLLLGINGVVQGVQNLLQLLK